MNLAFPANAVSCEKIAEFDLDDIAIKVTSRGPTLSQLMYGLAGTNKKPSRDIDAVVPTIFSMLIFLASQKSNRLQVMMGLYLFSSRYPKNVLDVLSRAGLCVSHPSIVSGLERLTDDAVAEIMKAAQNHPLFLLCDNINFNDKKADQRSDNPASVEIASSVIIVALNADEILKPAQPLKPEVTKTYPLPLLPIDQSSIEGNIRILETVMKDVLKLPGDWFDDKDELVRQTFDAMVRRLWEVELKQEPGEFVTNNSCATNRSSAKFNSQ
ncbi:hypothetical protein BGX26_007722 [Mortierella sp. AD094]|nr:hypothetical protein BGX26_007722 [Mortierella sp. AD094]